ncbi:SCO family protein [Aliiglaciecola sp. CAU 1673]|uniref:SCO family protein n=1 Tax=Aliiglaciecola sp. CAU 1673 TaxID=3032595 RepID=UPI0023DC33AB|nr:SCO family protein [Aliiglaciecola sp. CAU 1673]MDF2179250.1 SCO family protein [Aliiglaciecola sp. CAU 1673]
MSSRFLWGVLVALALLGGIGLSLLIAPPKTPQHAQLYPQARDIPPFELVDQHGKAVTLEALKGHWTLAFTGYTYCPDICPTTLAELKRVYPELKALPTDSPLQILFLSVDPNRDTPARLNEYVQFFNPDFIAATGEHVQLFPFVRSLGMMYAIAGSTETPDYLVDHSSSVVIIDPEARVLGRFKPELIPGQMAIVDADHILADMPIVMRMAD